ncbi:MAG: SIS domain-containing protein [Thermoanaerobaculia bacterium]|nr:SIS domain-containing protein [Thermoanaerobaculia bacterium]
MSVGDGRSVLHGEIFEQPAAVAHLLERERRHVAVLSAGWRRANVPFVLVAARGTSDNAARYAKYAFGLASRLPVALAAPSLITLYGVPPRLRGALVIGISQSGRSPDIVETIAAARSAGSPTLAIVNDPESPLARAAAEVLPLHAGVERSVAATKTYTTALAAIALLVLSFARRRKELDALLAMPDAMGRALRSEAAAHRAARVLERADRAVVLARGLHYATAFEIALKLKELALLLAEPFSAADFQHGPIAMAEKDLPVILVSPPATRPEAEMRAVARDLARRGSPVIRIGPRGNGAIPSPAVPEFLAPLVSVIPGQRLAYHAALARGFDPDRPRGIRKVTETR